MNHSGYDKNDGGMMGGCYVYPASPPTPGKVTPDAFFDRGVYMDGSITMDDGKSVRIWGFYDRAAGGGMGGGMGNKPFPRPPSA